MSEDYTVSQPNIDTWNDSYEQRIETDLVKPVATLNPNKENSLTVSELDPETIEAKERREDGLYLSPTNRFLAEDILSEPADEVEKVSDGGRNGTSIYENAKKLGKEQPEEYTTPLL